jgi:hypothetical protein
LTAQHPNDDPVPATPDPDPIGPITLTKRSQAGVRALVLLGTCTTHTSIQDPH